MTPPVYITNYTQTAEWNPTHAVSLHAATYASQIYKTITREFDASREQWSMAMTYGWYVHNILKTQPWENKDHAELTHQPVGGNCTTIEWQKRGDFVVITMAWVVLIVDVASAKIETAYFNGARLNVSTPHEWATYYNKRRQVDNGTWRLHKAVKTQSVMAHAWHDGTSISVGD